MLFPEQQLLICVGRAPRRVVHEPRRLLGAIGHVLKGDCGSTALLKLAEHARAARGVQSESGWQRLRGFLLGEVKDVALELEQLSSQFCNHVVAAAMRRELPETTSSAV